VIVHLELHTPNLGRACAFYGELLGWRAERVVAGGSAYQALDLGGLSGGVVECGTERAAWLPYVSVPSVDEATRRAADQLGAAVLLPPREGPAGWRSVVSGPDAGEIAFWQAKP